ncbi:hypothetical protein [Bacillus sp. JJ722]|uniref:hypothetical protein n=1 Tax=Bacillus sp. JJ722 TaxID=3122973 RepID=UPI002FFE35C7
MKKTLVIIVVVAVIALGGAFVFLKANSPLADGTIAWTQEKKIALVGVGNKMPFGEIQIENVLVNNDHKPTDVKVQVSNVLKGFVLTDNMNEEKESEIPFKDLHTVRLQSKTDPEKQLNKVNDGTATKNDITYAIMVQHNQEIHEVIVEYRYLGILFKEKFTIK